MEYREIGTKNIRHLWSVLCSSSVLSADTNNLSLNNLIERITIPISKEQSNQRNDKAAKGYIIPIEFEVVSRFLKTTDQALALELKFDIVNPQGAILVSLPPNNFGIQKGIKNLRLRTKITPLPVDQSGEFTIVVLIKEAGESQFSEVDRIPLEVILKE